MTRKRKPARKRVPAYLDAERVRQLAELKRRNGGSDSAAIGQAISFHHAHLKKEWPNDFT